MIQLSEEKIPFVHKKKKKQGDKVETMDNSNIICRVVYINALGSLNCPGCFLSCCFHFMFVDLGYVQHNI